MLRGRVDDVSGTRRGVQPVSASAGRLWGRPGRVCGAAVRAVRAGGRGDGGSAQNRGGVSADRSGESSAAGGVHARRRGARGRGHHGWAALPVGGTRLADHRCRRCFSGISGHAPTHAGRSEPRLHPVHLGHYRRAQRRGDHPSQRHQAVRITAGTLVGGAGVVAVSFLWLRRLGVGDLGRVARWWATGDRARVGGGLAERLSWAARGRTRQRADSDSGCGGNVADAGFGVGGVGGGR